MKEKRFDMKTACLNNGNTDVRVKSEYLHFTEIRIIGQK